MVPRRTGRPAAPVDHGGLQPLDQLAADGAVHEDPLAGGAALSGAQVGRLEDGVDRGREVGVVQHDQRAVAAELEDLGLARGPGGDRSAGGHRADEGDRVHARDGRRARRRPPAPAPFRKLSTPGGQARLAVRQHGGEHGRAGGRGRRGQPHDRVAGGQRGREQLGRHRVRPVPGHDDPGDAERHPLEQHPPARVDRRRDAGPRGARRPRPPCAGRPRARPSRRRPRPAACPGRRSAPGPARRAGRPPRPPCAEGHGPARTRPSPPNPARPRERPPPRRRRRPARPSRPRRWSRPRKATKPGPSDRQRPGPRLRR